MTSARIACSLAILAVLCVLFIFFFQALDGPYSAVHGPVTALLSLRAATQLRMGIRAVMNAICICISCALFASFFSMMKLFLMSDEGGFIDTLIEGLAPLRC